MHSRATLLAVASRHIWYEAQMLRWTALELARSLAGETSLGTYQSNALVESCLAHTRVLAEFLDTSKSKRQYKDDVLARDYLPSWDLEPRALNNEVRTQIDRRVMHLSAERVKGQIGWWVVGIAHQVMIRLGSLLVDIDKGEDRDLQEALASTKSEVALFFQHAERYLEFLRQSDSA